MAQKIKDLDGLFNKLRKEYEEIVAEDQLPGLLDEFDGDRRILTHAVFYIVSKALAKKLEGLIPFELLRIFEDRMLRIFITDPNSERVDNLLEKADLLYEFMPFVISDFLADDEIDEDYTFPEEALCTAQGLLVVAGAYSIGTDDDHLDPLLDSLSLRTGKVGSPRIEADADEIMETAHKVIYESDYYLEEEDEDKAHALVEFQKLDLERQMLVVGLLSINMDSFAEVLDCEKFRSLRDEVEAVRSAFEDGESPDEIEDGIECVIEGIEDVVVYIMDENRPSDTATDLLCSMFVGSLTVCINNVRGLSDEQFAEVWSEVHPYDFFDDDALIAYSREIVGRDLPQLIKDYYKDGPK